MGNEIDGPDFPRADARTAARAMSGAKVKHTAIWDGVKRLTCCGVPVGNNPYHDWNECLTYTLFHSDDLEDVRVGNLFAEWYSPIGRGSKAVSDGAAA